MQDNSIAFHMKELGLSAPSHATWHATTMSFENPYWPELSVLQAAHAAEILIKARIAEKNPELIFKKPVAPLGKNEDALGSARTHQYSDLPAILVHETGIKLSNAEMYYRFGIIRNKIQHFLPPTSIDFSVETVRFIFEVVDPLIQECWGIYAIDFNEEPDTLAYIVEYLINKEIPFGISPDLLKDPQVRLEWAKSGAKYRKEMHLRISSSSVRK
jgi:hypothetical protein